MFNRPTEKKIPEFEVFVIYDSKVGTYRMPIFAINKFDVVREFEKMMKDPEQQKRNEYYSNAEDFQIFKIGEYSKGSGAIIPAPHEHIANLHELKSAVQRSTAAQQRYERPAENAPLGIVST